jgi:hypothetical protein
VSYIDKAAVLESVNMVIPTRYPRMVISTEGLEGSGKTDFAIRNTPRPLTYLDFDYGLEGVGTPEMWEGITRKPYDLMATNGFDEALTKRHVAAVLKQFIADFRQAVKDEVRTLVVDTFTAAWNGQRIARSEDKYVEYEEEFRSLIRSVYASPVTNLILIHHMKPDWKRDGAGKSYLAGTHSRAGMDGIITAVQLAIRQRFVAPIGQIPGRFEMDIIKSRDNIGLVGTTLPALDFPTLCSMVCPSIDWSK